MPSTKAASESKSSFAGIKKSDIELTSDFHLIEPLLAFLYLHYRETI
ncbi:hypothetical protein [Colwellia ponticola]|nr:hypothetical protein [Colwellia ponticola]